MRIQVINHGHIITHLIYCFALKLRIICNAVGGEIIIIDIFHLQVRFSETIRFEDCFIRFLHDREVAI